MPLKDTVRHQIEQVPKTADWNMQKDFVSLQKISAGDRPILHFYEWLHPSATYGYFVDPWDFFDPKGVQQTNLSLAKRPTGGGILFHTDDLAFSLIVPSTHKFYHVNPLDSYLAINQVVVKALIRAKLHYPFELLTPQPSPRASFCMTHPTTYDILVEGRKCGGAAERKTKEGLLHQATVCLWLPPKILLQDSLKEGTRHFEHLQKTSFCLASSQDEAQALKKILKIELLRCFEESF